MIRFKHVARLLSLLLVLAVVFAPVAPAFASAVKIGNEHAVHAAHDCDHQADDSGRTDHHPSTCTQHDSCAGQCCACCAHCSGAMSLFQPAYIYSHPVRTPVLSQLHSHVLVTSLDRPPRTFSL